MLVTGGIFAAFQRNLARIMSYGAIAETGFSMLALSLDVRIGIPVLFLLIPARALGLAVWSLSVTVIKGQVETLRFGAVQGILRILPFAGTGMIIAALSTALFPCWPAFPADWRYGKTWHAYSLDCRPVDGHRNCWPAHQHDPFAGGDQHGGGIHRLGAA